MGGPLRGREVGRDLWDPSCTQIVRAAVGSWCPAGLAPLNALTGPWHSPEPFGRNACRAPGAEGSGGCSIRWEGARLGMVCACVYCVHVCTCVHVCMSVCAMDGMHMCVDVQYAYAYMCACLCMGGHVCVYRCVLCTYMCVYMCMPVYTRVCVCALHWLTARHWPRAGLSLSGEAAVSAQKALGVGPRGCGARGLLLNPWESRFPHPGPCTGRSHKWCPAGQPPLGRPLSPVPRMLPASAPKAQVPGNSSDSRQWDGCARQLPPPPARGGLSQGAEQAGLSCE